MSRILANFALNMAQFNSYIDYLDLSAATEYCRENGVLCRLKKNERFVQEGTKVRYAALVVSGYFKITTLNTSGDEAVLNFAFPGQFITDFHSSLHGEPSEMSVIAGEDSEILRLPLAKFKKFLSPSLTNEYRALFDMVFNRYLGIHRKSPRERYLELCEEYPRIVETVSLKDLSSYLLITPNHLSRIRRQLANEAKNSQRK